MTCFNFNITVEDVNNGTTIYSKPTIHMLWFGRLSRQLSFLQHHLFKFILLENYSISKLGKEKWEYKAFNRIIFFIFLQTIMNLEMNTFNFVNISFHHWCNIGIKKYLQVIVEVSSCQESNILYCCVCYLYFIESN